MDIYYLNLIKMFTVKENAKAADFIACEAKTSYKLKYTEMLMGERSLRMQSQRTPPQSLDPDHVDDFFFK